MTHPGPTSKFRHIQGAVMHRNTHITNMRGLNLTTPGECDGFCVNRERVAVPLAISGGQIAIFEVQLLFQTVNAMFFIKVNIKCSLCKVLIFRLVLSCFRK